MRGVWLGLVLVGGCASSEVSFQIEGSRLVDVGTWPEPTDDWSFTFDVFDVTFDRIGVRDSETGAGPYWAEGGPFTFDLTPDNGPFEVEVVPVEAQPYDRAMVRPSELVVQGKAEKANDLYTFFFVVPLQDTVMCVPTLDLTDGGTAELVSTWAGEQLFRTALDWDSGEISLDPWIEAGASGPGRSIEQEELEAIDISALSAAGLEVGDAAVESLWEWVVEQAAMVPRAGDPCTRL